MCIVSKKQKNTALISVVIITFVAIMILNIYTPLIADDFSYSFIHNTDTRIESIVDIFKSQYIHYFNWGGRTVAHSFAQLFLFMGKGVFNIVNSIMYVLLVLLISKHGSGIKKISVKTFIIVNILILFFMPVFGQTILWLVGSCNYLWSSVFVLAFLLPYRLYYDDQKAIKNGKSTTFLLGILGLIAGWTNENTAGAMILLSIIFIGIYMYKKITIPKWALCGAGAAIVGFLFMIIAPGNYVRAGVASENMGLIRKLISRFYYITVASYNFYKILAIIMVVLIAIYIKYKNDNYEGLKLCLLYSFITIAAVYAGVLAPFLPSRAYFGATCFLFIAIVNITVNISFNSKRINNVVVVLFVSIVVTLVATYIGIVSEIKDTYVKSQHREKQILSEREHGNLNIVAYKIVPKTKYNPLFGLDDIEDDKEYWTNIIMAKYYDINSIVSK